MRGAWIVMFAIVFAAAGPASDTVAQGTSGTESPFGVHKDGPFWEHQDATTWLLNEDTALGAPWLRVNVWWDSIEHFPGRYDWEPLDSLVSQATARRIHLLVTLRGYGQTDRFEGHPAAKLDAYRRWIAATVTRYVNRVTTWQIENEVTSRRSWRLPLDDYPPLLSAAYATIKAVQPGATVLLSSIGSNFVQALYSGSPGRPRRRPERVFRQLFEATKGHFDVADFHLYLDLRDLGARVRFLRRRLAGLGIHTPIWVTETGGPDARVDPVAAADRHLVAREVVERYVIELNAGVQRIFWHSLQVRRGRTTPWANMGLIIGRDRQPAFVAYQVMVRMLGGFTAVQAFADDTVHGGRFTSSNDTVYVLWADTPRVFTVSTAPNARVVVTTLDDRSTTAVASRIPVGADPIFVTTQ